jgi:hypothetical protein
MESDLNKVKQTRDAIGFENVLTRIIDSALTNDFWNISLPNDLLVTSNRILLSSNSVFFLIHKKILNIK